MPKNVVMYPQTNFIKELYIMAKKVIKKSAPVKTVTRKGPGRPAAVAVESDEDAPAKPKGKPVVVFLPKKLHGRVRMLCTGLSTNVSEVTRKLLEEWAIKNKKKLLDIINAAEDDDDEDEEEDTEEDTDTEDAEDESDEEESEDEEEDEDEDDE